MISGTAGFPVVKVSFLPGLSELQFLQAKKDSQDYTYRYNLENLFNLKRIVVRTIISPILS
jgi:hypothetical protein